MKGSNRIWLRHTETTQADKYHNFIAAQRALANEDFSALPAAKRVSAQQAISEKNAQLLKLREVGPASVQDDKFLTSFSVQYANPEFIGEMLMPPAPVPHISGTYVKYDESRRMGFIDDTITGRKGANEIDDGEREQNPYLCVPRSLKDHLDWVTMANQAAPLNEMLDLTMALADQVGVNREHRISDVMTTSGNYDSGNVIAVAAADRFDSADGGDPLSVILDMNAKLWKGRGAGRTMFWCSLEVWNVLARHPQLLDIMKYTQGGLMRPQSLAEYFGWDGVLIGEARYRSSRKGQADTYARFWGNNMGLTRVAVTPSVRQAAFGYTFRWNGVRTRVWFDNELFTDGGYTAQTSHHEDYRVVANKAGVLVTTPIAPF